VIEPDAPEANALQQLLPLDSRAPSQSFVGVVSREIALQILGAAAPAPLDWLEDECTEGQRSLPVIYAAQTGLRTKSIAYEST